MYNDMPTIGASEALEDNWGNAASFSIVLDRKLPAALWFLSKVCTDWFQIMSRFPSYCLFMAALWPVYGMFLACLWHVLDRNIVPLCRDGVD